MTFSLKTWSRTTSSGNEPIDLLQDGTTKIGAPRVYTYVSTDAQATIEGAGYFNDVAGDLVTGDVILSYSTGDATWVWLTVTNSNGYGVPPFGGTITTSVFAAAGTVGTGNITNNAVTYAKIQQASATTLIGNPTGGLANVEEITLGNGLDFSGTTLEVSKSVAVSARVSLADTDITGMYVTPVLLAAAGGANTLLVCDVVAFNVVFGTTQFAGGGAMFVQYDSTTHGAGTKATGTIAAATFNAIAASSIFTLLPAAVAPVADATVVNKGLYLANDTGAFTTGDSAMVVDIRYRVVPTV